MTTENKTALVTGISRGIGEAIGLKLLNAGWTVFGTYNTGVQEAKNLKAAHPNLTILQTNFSDRSQTKRLLNELSAINFDAIVNNAGMIEFENFDDFDFDIWDVTFEVNLNAPLLVTIGLKDQLNPNASIVNVSSLDGFVGSFASMSYSASKAALINLTKSLGNNLGALGIRVNAIAPGWIDTGMSTEESQQATKITPLGRNGTPSEVASLVEFLLSDQSSFINGETIVIDGGFGNVDYIMLQEARGQS